jgi:para-nitrobenzyl esterase
MKKLFTIDDFMVAFISALGYGFGYTIPMHLGWSQLACMVSCFALGIALEELISKLVFLLAEFVSMRLLGASLVEDLEEEFVWVVVLQFSVLW